MKKWGRFTLQAWQLFTLQIRRPQHPQHVGRHDGRHQPGAEADGHARAPAVQAHGGAHRAQAMSEGHLAEVGLVTASDDSDWLEIFWGGS